MTRALFCADGLIGVSDVVHHSPIKTEASPSPDLLPAPSIHELHANFQSQSSHGSRSPSRFPSDPPHPSCHPPIFRFGAENPAYTNNNLMSWSPSQQDDDSASKYDLGLAISFPEEYEDISELVELPPGSPPMSLSGAQSTSGDRQIRRRSSKACDQCRKSKCKCERSSPNEPCKSCVMLGTACTFLGPSRKRGPPKGYIDAIEARLHQTEALLGIMLSSGDERAQSLLDDLATDPLAKEIINRVDNSPYGVKGRKPPGGTERRQPSKAVENLMKSELASTHPSNEWQDQVTAMLKDVASRRRSDGSNAPPENEDTEAPRGLLRNHERLPSILTALPDDHLPAITSLSHQSPSRRRRRRIEVDSEPSYSSQSHERSPALYHRSPSPMYSASARRLSFQDDTRNSYLNDFSAPSDDEDLAGAVGQLSLNEEEEVRYHGKASGLHLLGTQERRDSRNEGGIWRFPKARIWPLLPSRSPSISLESEMISKMPHTSVQEQLLDAYFTYVHPSLPIIHKRTFWETLGNSRMGLQEANTPDSDTSSTSRVSSSPFHRRRRRVAPVLLFAMFSVAARYTSDPPPCSDGSTMWAAGDEYLNYANVLLDRSYASSRPSTCQALLLLGYREIGIGAMAQAWSYIGMAIRMAQDLGLHRCAEGWSRENMGGRLFDEWELNERRRVWYACVIMDKYVSSYIGRPLAISERDFDTLLPPESDPEEFEECTQHDGMSVGREIPLPAGRIISCFNATSRISGILSMIIQAIYAVRPVSSRHEESVFLEAILDKWYLELPSHLRHDPSITKQPVPLPHVLVLHMQYWCAVLLLHRPFIRQGPLTKPKSSPDPSEEPDLRASTEKSYELCAAAANHITSTATLYANRYPMKRSSVFPCYYIFTASIMHITSLSLFPDDPQAQVGLNRCMELLKDMEVIWPSAGRALELLRGANFSLPDNSPGEYPTLFARRKRSADEALDFSPTVTLSHSTVHDNPPTRSCYPSAYASVGRLSGPGPGPSQPATMFSFERWPTDNSVPYPGMLATSVLPQMYTSHFGDDRSILHGRVGIEQQVQGHPHHIWNDYPTYNQLGNAYSTYQSHPAPSSSHELFLPDQYDM